MNNNRENKIDYINNKISVCSDSIVTQLYDDVKNNIVSNEVHTTRHKKIIFISDNMCFADEEIWTD